MAATLLMAAACTSGSTDDPAATAGRTTTGGVIPADLTGLVVAGAEAGWVVDRDGAVWRVQVDGDATQTGAELPTYNRGFATFFDGVVVFGGTRCDGSIAGESCDGEVVVEMRLLHESDGSIETVELFRADGGRYRSVGAGVLGISDDRAWVYRDTGELSAVDAEGTITDLTVPAGAESRRRACMVDGALHGIRDASSPADSGGEPAPVPTVHQPGSSPTQNWVVDRWDGAAWVALDGGAQVVEGVDTTVTCTDQGYVIHPYGPHNPLAGWTPGAGWQRSSPTIAGLDLSSLLTSSSNTLYTVSGGTLQRVDLVSDRLVATPITEADLGPGTIDVVDDAGTLLMACTSAGRDSRCLVTPDP